MRAPPQFNLPRHYSGYSQIRLSDMQASKFYLSDNSLVTTVSALDFLIMEFFQSDNREYKGLLPFIGHSFQICRSL